MKYIRKKGIPRKYLNWCKVAIRTGQNYTDLPGKIKDILLKGLLEEQGFICAYTLRHIVSVTSHVEHIKPEGLLRQEDKLNGTKGSDLDYSNMVACFPRNEHKSHIAYGAKKKDGWWENDGVDFISPLIKKCEASFQFNIKGVITAKSNQRSAKKTIEVLGLDHPSLTDDRRRVIHEYIYGPDGQEPLNLKKTEIEILNVLKRKEDNKYYEFCIPIRDALLEHKKTLLKIAKRKKYAKQQSKKKKK